jgi:NCS1 family nucleobase:cation symporter-1
MQKVKSSKIAHWSSELAVESEPNLTTAQLMLFNYDLKPVRISVCDLDRMLTSLG